MANIAATDQSVFQKLSNISPAISLGSGFDSGTKTVQNMVAEGLYDHQPRPAADARYIIDWCETYSKLSSFFSLNASASYEGTGTGVSASVNMMRETTLKTSRIYIAVSVRMIANMEFFKSARLINDALTVLNTESLSAYSEKFGGSFVKTLFQGGELACVIEIAASSTENIEQLRASMSLQGWGAKGGAEMVQFLKTLTESRSVVVRYAQSGGSVGKTSTGPIVTTTQGLIARMGEFIGEVWGTTGLDGVTVAMEAEIVNQRKLLNWPPSKTGDPDRPYPPDVEQMATALLNLKDRKREAESLIGMPGLSPAAIETAHELVAFVESAILIAGTALTEMMRDPTLQAQLSVETFYQNRIRKHLDVDPGKHPNAGEGSNIAVQDPDQVMDRIFGATPPNLYEPWPKLIKEDYWGYQGQEPGYGIYGSFHVVCTKHGGNINQRAQEMAGNPGPKDGVLAFASAAPHYYNDGQSTGACGYTAVHVVIVRTEKPATPLLEALPSLTADAIELANIKIANPRIAQVTPNRWKALFDVDIGQNESCGRYTLRVKTSKNELEIEAQLRSYWIQHSTGKATFEQEIDLEDGWVPTNFEVSIDKAFRLPH